MSEAPSNLGTVGREHESDPFADDPRCPADGAALVAVGDSRTRLWELIVRELDELRRRCPQLTVVQLDLDPTAGGTDGQLARRLCDHHDLDVHPVFLLYTERRRQAVKMGAVNAERLERFATDR